MNLIENIISRIIPPKGTQIPVGIAKPAQAEEPRQEVNVTDILNGMATERGQKLNWRDSIVDLLKLLDMDSSLESRRKLAQELNYKGNTDDTATMNRWLHQQVMLKLAENGGRVPDELKH